LKVVFVVVAGLAALIALRVRPPKVVEVLSRIMHASSQLPVRLCACILACLVVLAETFDLDMILGALAAGMVVGLAGKGQGGETLPHSLDALGFGFFVAQRRVSSIQNQWYNNLGRGTVSVDRTRGPLWKKTTSNSGTADTG
jgi:hypothetical protein